MMTYPGFAQILCNNYGLCLSTGIVRGTGKSKCEVETGLWELVTAGVLTADGFENLRALIGPKRRAGRGTGPSARPRHSGGRWSLLSSGESTDRLTAIETICRVLLQSHGVVVRELAMREPFPVKWRELLITFRR
jgi:ATP-dependent Lhr-like helicase